MKRPSLLSRVFGGALALALIACGPPDIDKTFTEGTHYGFTVGENAYEAYAEFQRQILEGGHTSYDECEARDADGALAARGLANMRLWRHPYLFGYRNGRTNGPVRVPLDSFVVGLDSSRARLRRLMRDSAYDALEVSLRAKDFGKEYDPCLADPRIQHAPVPG